MTAARRVPADDTLSAAFDTYLGMVMQLTNELVYISDRLPALHPAIVADLRSSLGSRLRMISGTQDIWCRDFMPIQLGPDRFVQFRYAPDYLKDDPQLRTDDGARLLDLAKDAVRSRLFVDGGNVVRLGHTAILTDKVFSENPRFSRRRVEDELRRVLEVDRLVIIPTDPEDPIGHADGMVRFVDETTVLVSDYRQLDRAFADGLDKALASFEIIPFPFCPTDEPGEDPEIPPAIGVYINFLQTEEIIFCPTFGLREDEQALDILRRCFPSRTIVPVRSNKLAMDGGVLNCATWDVRMVKG